MEYNDKWQSKLSEDEWDSFLNISKSDDVCNKMWDDYRNKIITYDEVSRYEFSLYISYLRDKKIDLLCCEMCKSDFNVVATRGPKKKFCDECRIKRKEEIKQKYYDKIKPIRYKEERELSELWKIPVRYITLYGIDFLKKNPLVVEVLQSSVKLSGQYRFLTDDEKSFRRKVVYKTNNRKQRIKKGYDTKVCVVCQSTFTYLDRPSTRAITCSDDCSEIRKKNKVKECSIRFRNKNKNKK
jgi:hypothetical protein